jgi:uncharacterized protein (TIGR03435 family)
MSLSGIHKSLWASITVIMTVCAHAQRPAKSVGTLPLFEAATVRRNMRPNPGGFSSFGGCRGVDSNPGTRSGVPLGRCRFVAFSLRDLICRAYIREDGILCSQAVTGGPSWAVGEEYDVEGETEDPATADEAKLLSMLQTFLADSFKLQFHHQTRQVDGYELIVQRGRSHWKVSSPDLGSSIEFFGDGRIVVSHATMSDFANSLGGMLHGPVRDRTNLRGAYDFTINREGADPESLAHALEDQIGLRLQPKKAAVDTIAIDHAERPPSN